ncbi:MAG: spore coat protein U domain-containing protein [Limnobacter sp.]|nr:spore coat protein U domain-containing protein [Limnobacter sp.]
MRLNHKLRITFAFALALLASPAYALLSNCTVTPISGPGLQIYNPGATSDLSTTFNVQVSCIALISSGNRNVSLSFDGGLTGDPANRQAAFGSDRLNYNLFLPGGAVASNVGSGLVNLVLSLNLISSTVHTEPVTLVIPKNQYVPAGTYTDTVTVTVTFD